MTTIDPGQRADLEAFVRAEVRKLFGSVMEDPMLGWVEVTSLSDINMGRRVLLRSADGASQVTTAQTELDMIRGGVRRILADLESLPGATIYADTVIQKLKEIMR